MKVTQIRATNVFLFMMSFSDSKPSNICGAKESDVVCTERASTVSVQSQTRYLEAALIEFGGHLTDSATSCKHNIDTFSADECVSKQLPITHPAGTEQH